MVNVDEMLAKNERLRIVDEVAGRVRFHHWELRFADLIADRGGFDLIVGNPPWVKVEWNEGGLLGEMEPVLALRDCSASDIATQRDGLLNSTERRAAYQEEFVEQEGAKTFLNSLQNYPYLKKVQTNLYKCFFTISWDIGNANGTVGMVHQEGIYDDPKGGMIRQHLYRRLLLHCRFINELMLFDIGDRRPFGFSICRTSPSKLIGFTCMCNLFHPSTVHGSMNHDGLGVVPGVKTDQDTWELRPHRDRLITVNADRLSLFSRLYDEAGTPAEQARLPVIHSEEIVCVLEKFAAQCRKLGDLEGNYYATVMWDETNAVKIDHTIRRETRFPNDVSEWIVSGPHFYVGTPFNKIPNVGCSTKGDYTPIDLTVIPDDYLPRTNYVPACSPEEYRRRTPKFKGKPVTEFYRHVHRRQLAPTGERTLINTIVPPAVGHIDSVVSSAFADSRMLLLFSGLCVSLAYDFFVKTTGKSDMRQDLLQVLPLPRVSDSLHAEILRRVLRLNCLTRPYAPLWESITGTPWHRSCALRTDRERRQALVELDALAALALDLTEEELITIYRVQFPVLRQYERENLYDQTGRIVPKGVLDLAKRHNIDIRQPLNISTFSGPTDVVDHVETPSLGVTGGIVWEDPKMEPRMKRVYPPPFTKCDREADMRQAYRTFQERLGSQESAP
jgi:hypothetical protein